jgi:hypothetical protein
MATTLVVPPLNICLSRGEVGLSLKVGLGICREDFL